MSVLRGHSFFSSLPQRPNDLRLRRMFYSRFYPLHLFSYLNSWGRASIFPFECSVLNKGTTGTIFITSLVWRGPWLGIEPGTSRTRSLGYRGGGERYYETARAGIFRKVECVSLAKSSTNWKLAHTMAFTVNTKQLKSNRSQKIFSQSQFKSTQVFINNHLFQLLMVI